MLAPIPAPPPSQQSVIIKKPRSLARRLMQEAGSGPLPVFALRIQDRARATANDFLREHGYREHRLYVLEIAGHTEAGQTATFDGDTAHTYRGSGTETCHLIMTVHLPPGPAATT